MGNVVLYAIEGILAIVAISYFVQKKVLIGVLAICTGALLYLVVNSITGEEDFNAQIEQREDVVKNRLREIQAAEEAYKECHNDAYTAGFDTLIDFVKNGRVYEVVKEGVLSEYQQQHGWNDSTAAVEVYRIKQANAGNEAAIAAAIQNGELKGFRIDTIWKPAMSIFADKKKFPYEVCADSLSKIPFSGGREFDLMARRDSTRSGMKIYIMQCAAPDETFLTADMGPKIKQKLADRAEFAMERNAYAGLKIGSETADEWNNNGGNWDNK